MDLENQLLARLVGADNDVRLFSYANLVADRVDRRRLLVGVQGKVVEPAVCEPVAVIFGVSDFGNEANLCEVGDAPVDAGA